MKWDYVEAGILHIKRILSWRGFQVNVHRITGADSPGMFHSHPAKAIRIILRGGYTEELPGGKLERWWPGKIGIIYPHTVHRIHEVKDSWTLWIRWPIKAPIFVYRDAGGQLFWIKTVQTPKELR